MNYDQFAAITRDTLADIEALLDVKGGEYSTDDDRLSNFKRGAALTGVTPLQCAFVYASKHYDAVATFIRDNASGKIRPRSEPIEGRLDDLINYCILLKALIIESEGSRHD